MCTAGTGGTDVAHTGLVIAAAGQGERLGLDAPKALLDLEGVPMVVHALRLFEPFDLLDTAAVAAPADHLEHIRAALTSHFGDRNNIRVVEGGSHRQGSVYNALRALPADTETVVIHDAARPFTSPQVIARCIDCARESGAAVVAVPIVDTIIDVDADGTVAGTLDRSRLWAVQTPQVFRYKLILEAHDQAAAAKFMATDDAALAVRAGHDIEVVMGSYDNIKITVQRDLLLARQILRDQCCV